MDDDPPSFWSFSLPPGSKLSQAVPQSGCVCLTSAVLAEPSDGRVVLMAASGGMSAVLCNLFTRGDGVGSGHEVAKLGQPFHEDFELFVVGGSADVHVSGFYRGDLGPAEVLRDARAPIKVSTKAPPAASGSGPSAAERGRAVSSKAQEEEEEDEDEDDEDGEEEDEDEDDEGESEEEDEEEEEDDDEMPLAPSSVEAILRGKAPSAKRPAAGPPAGAGEQKRPKEAAREPPAAKPAKGTDSKPKGDAVRRLPSGVEVQDISGGAGAVAAKGKKVKVKYVGNLTNGKMFDSGTITFKLGAGEVIPGWDKGLEGMKVGGKRKLKIPPQLAYGKRGAPPTIPPNATLLFDCTLMGC